jgi:uncharacterized membrane protein YphA (DoxX/SURF4 family)
MQKSIFLQFQFYALVVFSIVLPIAILAGLLTRRAIARSTVFLFGVLLIVLSGIDFVLLRRLAVLATHTPSLFDDQVFGSELSVALYLLPVVFAGIGTNVVSHVLIQHLTEAEKRFDQEHPRSN